jgi:acyl-CoA synthetase (AMP-forming)/AMP-acid ligase II
VTDWNYADVWEAVADVQPDAEAIVQGGRRLTYAEFDRRADGVARHLLDLGTERQDKVALYLYNSPEYLEAQFAALKASCVPVNTNYRYREDELAYLWDNADAVGVVFHGAFAERVEAVRGRVPGVRSWLWVDDGSGPCPEWADPYDDIAASAKERTVPDWGRSGDDLFMLYTGGTTGMPKGVMWRQDDLFCRLNAGGFRPIDLEVGLEGLRHGLESSGPGVTLLSAPPLMHGTGGFTTMECLVGGGRVVLLAQRSYDPVEVLDSIDGEKVNGLVIVGDSFARPLLEALDAEPDRWNLSSLVGIVSSGAMWSEEIKRGLLGHHAAMLLVDAFSSSEALGMGNSVSSAAGAADTARFTLGTGVKVLDPEGHEVAPGSDTIGVLALGGRNPVGYYKDATKTNATFKTIGGVRYSIPGDHARVNADGSIQLLGRGSGCINTAGEKVFPEEVEEALKTHPAVSDAVVVGVPDDQFGERVVATVELGHPAGNPPNEAELIEHVKARLAPFKAPRRVRVVDTIGRAPNGKVDYRRHRAEALDWVGASA